MGRPLLLDLFCGAGGCAVGYYRAGFDVVGVDIKPQPHYPFEFHQADALDYLDASGKDFDAIHASPPCQGYSRMRHLPWLKGRSYPMLIDETIKRLEATGKTWVVENVEDAWKHMRGSVLLCGTMFGLKIYRHRLFLSNAWLWQPPHGKHKHVIGRGRMLNDRATPSCDGWVSLPSKATKRNALMTAAQKAMEIDWMTSDELAQGIPPAYTEYVGKNLLSYMNGALVSGRLLLTT